MQHLPALGRAQVDGDALLVAVEVQVVGALAAEEVGADAPGHVADAWLLYLDYLRSQVAQRPRRHRPGDGLRHFEDADALERRGH